MREAELQRAILVAASAEGHRLFRQNVGRGWVGRLVRRHEDGVVLAAARPLLAGLCVGSADLIGWTRTGRFASVEVKGPTTRITPAQVTWRDQVLASGGCAVIARSVEEALQALEGGG